MMYVGQFAAGRSLQIQQQGDQTAIALLSTAPGQQQQQQLLIATGAWLVPPTLFKLPMGLVLRLETAHGQQFVHVQATSLHTLTSPPNLLGAEVLPLQQMETPATSPMADWSPLPPLEMGKMGNMGSMSLGDMQTQINPMVMRMGNMELRMEASSAASSAVPTNPTPAATPTGQRFCTQCGHPVKAGDRFCGACGHGLASE